MVLKTYSFSKKHNSTKQITNEAPVKTYSQVYLKADTDLDHPIFLIDDSFSTANYCYLQDFGRYYFIDKWVLGNKNIYELHCSIDALATYKTYVGGYTAFVERSASNYNVQLYDPCISSEEEILQTSSASTNIFGTGGVYVCRVMNSLYGITTYMGDLTTFAPLFNPDFDDDPSIKEAIKGIVTYYLCNPGNYVIDTYFLAIPWAKVSSHCSIDVLSSGWYQGGGGAYRWTSAHPIINDNALISKPTLYYNDFRASCDAFSKYYLYLPAVGEIPIPGDYIEKPLALDFSVDVYTGELVYFLYCGANIVGTYHGNVKAGLQTGTLAPNGGSLITAASQIGTAVATGNPVAIGASVVNASQTILSTVPSINGAMGSSVGILTESDAILTQVVKASSEIPLAQLGRPCNKNLLLSTLSGFVKCAGASIEAPCNEDVKSMLNDCLNNGFYYE